MWSDAEPLARDWWAKVQRGTYRRANEQAGRPDEE
jgi:hypothetical protein